ncbi:MAG: hypothetical protein AB8B63_21430 [Granulosicoccus sp.]
MLPLGLASAADLLDTLPSPQREVVERICLPIQFKQGSQAYRSCLISESAARASLPTSPLAALPADEQSAIQLACRTTGPAGTAANQQCIEQQLQLLLTEPTPRLTEASSNEQYVIQQASAQVSTSQGGRAYRRCINEALDTLSEIPQVQLAGLSIADRNTLQQVCLGRTNDARDYRECLLGMVSGDQPKNEPADTGAESLVARTTANEQTATLAPPLANAQSVERQSGSDAVVFSPGSSSTAAVQPQTDRRIPDEPPPGSTQTASPPAIIAPPPLPRIPDPPKQVMTPATSSPAQDLQLQPQPQPRLPDDNPATNLASSEPPQADNSAMGGMLQKLQAGLSSLSGTDRLLLVAALSIPLLMIVFRTLFARRETVAYDRPPAEPTSHDQSIVDSPTTASTQQTAPRQGLREQADNLFDNLASESESGSETPKAGVSEDTSFAQSDPIINHEEEKTVRLPVVENASENADPAWANKEAWEDVEDDADPDLHDSEYDATIALDFNPAILSNVSGAFGHWLKEQASEKQLSFAIEFLVYWLAYADERYEASLKARVFKMKAPDEHTMIKRWVLQNDVDSFCDAVKWLQSRATEKQRTQIIDLLFALLVSEKALTPIQNTLFRFLGDAFGLGQSKLGARYRRAFEATMPPLPRVDKPGWWKTQSEEQVFRWNARAVARKPLDIQHRVKLGLPLTGNLKPADILRCHQKAAVRCNPDRFQELGEREITMIERQATKFDMARDSLMDNVL